MDFCLDEIITPKRIITTSVKLNTANGIEQIPVKTAQKVPLKEIPALMRKIKTLHFEIKPVLSAIIENKELLGDISLIVTGE
ncbi:MAG: DUF1667 domain-containing protein [Candidatus Margulisbacteria bacterium]|nr:DUF1667 domain-containing protein [Candidatus Margulisiibacteriota bacterium]